MATWEVKITPLNVERKEASITATRTDGEDVRIFHIITALLDTAQQKEDVINAIWSLYEADEIRRGKIASFIGNLESAAATALNAKEEA